MYIEREMCMHTYYVYTCIIYIYREREIERERGVDMCVYIYIYMYMYIYRERERYPVCATPAVTCGVDVRFPREGRQNGWQNAGATQGGLL